MNSRVLLQQSFWRSKSRFRTTLRTLVLLSGLLSAAGSPALDDKAGASAIEQAAAKLARGECNTAWNIAWPLAKDGSQNARNFLYAALNARLLPPGVTGDPATIFRHTLALAAYAALMSPEEIRSGAVSDRRFARIDVPGAIKHLNFGSNGERVADCYRTGPSFRTCLDLGISLRVIPTFEEYADETERRQEETGRPAACFPSH